MKPNEWFKGSDMIDFTRERYELSSGCIMHYMRGSIAHGMYIPPDNPESTDDIDTIAVYVAHPSFYFGIDSSDIAKELNGGNFDTVAYEAKKFISMCVQGNPNANALLWTDPKYMISQSWQGAELRKHRNIFLSQRIFSALLGYANGQLKKMMNREVFQGYMGEKRKALVNKYGYDTKMASHTMRLLSMCKDLAVSNKLLVERTVDRDLLISIKTGKFSLEEVTEMIDEEFKSCKRLTAVSNLQEYPDYEAANELCMKVVSSHIQEREVLEDKKYLYYSLSEM